MTTHSAGTTNLDEQTSSVDIDSQAKEWRLEGKPVGGLIQEPLLTREEIESDKSAREKISLTVDRAMEQLFPGLKFR